MTTSRRLAPLLLFLAGLAVLTLAVALTVHAQSQEVTPTAAATGSNPPAKPTNLQASAEHDAVTLTWTASTDQTVTHYAILRRNRDTDALGVFHVIDSNAGPESQLHRQLGSGGEQVRLPREGSQPHRRQPVVRLRQSRHPGSAGPDAYSRPYPHSRTRAGIHSR